MIFSSFLKRTLRLPVGVLLVGCASSALSAPGVLSKQPLFIGTSAQPNILFLIDDSGSMNWSWVLNAGAFSRAVNAHRLSDDDHCPGYNAMWFDPNKIASYVPWAGQDSNGNVYVNRTLSTASDNPHDADVAANFITQTSPGYGSSQNHDYGYYVPWNDADEDGEYDNGECDWDNPINVEDMPTQALRDGFANWYTYYRTREYISKRALSEIISDSTARVGLATLHNNGNVGTVVKNIDNFTTSSDRSTNQINKNALMEHLFESSSFGGTPLRTTLEEAGKYFDQNQTTPSGLFGQSGVASPILSLSENGECQQNFAVVMSDGAWNGGNPSVNNADGNNNTDWDGGDYGDSFSNTLADVAMSYYERDLSSLPNNVKTIPGVDENTEQHLVTFTVAFGVNGNLDSNPPWTGTESWQNPNTDATKIDDMRHAAYNGRGEFLSASNPQELIDTLNASIRSINNRQGSASAVAFSSTSLSTDTQIFQGVFDSRGWYGDLASFDLADNKLGSLNWRAGEELENRNLETNKRQIASYNGQRGVKFKFPVKYWRYFKESSPRVLDLTTDILNKEQMLDLLANAPLDIPVPRDTAGGTQDGNTDRLINQAFGESIVDYLQGDHSNEGLAQGNFRDRFNHRLGDIVNSSPKYVGAPVNLYPDDIGSEANLYSTFRADQKNRTEMVYVGANDGMLHAFKVSNGKEKFAYMPGLLFSDEPNEGMHFLADKQYTHTPYADGTPAVQDVFIDGEWRTYLVAGVRTGGMGIYVLDITNPDANSANSANSWVKFEFTHPDLGHTFSDPQIVKLNNGKWAAVMGNGYSGEPDGDGKAKLFFVYLDGSGYKIIDTGAGSIVGGSCLAISSDCNGLSTPIAVDITGDYVPDRVYAGDLHGNMWAFDISSTTDSHWDIAHKSGSTAEPLFTACSTTPCTQATRQPITAKPAVKVHGQRRLASHYPSLIVYFGTGQFIANADASNASAQTMYGVWDAGTSSLTRAQLKEQVISIISKGRSLTQYSPAYNEGAKSGMGWFIELPDNRERSVTSPVLFGSLLLFNTIVPDAASCDGGGIGYFMAVDSITGGKAKFKVLDLNGDGDLDDAAGRQLSSMGGEIAVIGNNAVFNQSDASLNILQISDKDEPGKRTSWTILR